VVEMFKKKKENETFNKGIVIYYFSIFLMPIVAMIGLAFLIEELVNIMPIIDISPIQMKDYFIGELILFLITWVALFISFMLHKFGLKYAQILVALFAFGYLIMNAYFSVTTYASIADIINPVILITASIYGVISPLPIRTVEKRKKRIANTFKITGKKSKKK
jgi:hypothetical protein